MSDAFWDTVHAQLEELKSAKTADDVLRIVAKERNPYGPECGVDGDGFFAGSSDDMAESLLEAGWEFVWAASSVYYTMRAPIGDRVYYVMDAPNRDQITVIEGDVYRGDRRSKKGS